MPRVSDRRHGRHKLTTALIIVSMLTAACSPFASDEETSPILVDRTSTSTQPATTDDDEGSPESTDGDGDEPAGGLVEEDAAGTVDGIVDGIGTPSIGDSLFDFLGNGGFDVTHIAIEIDATAPELDIATTLDVVPTAALTSFNLDFAGPPITELTVDGADADFERVDNELTITPPRPLTGGQTAEVFVRTAGQPDPGPDVFGLGLSGWITEPWGSYVASEPLGAQSWFPSNNHPTDKATYTIDVTVPSDQFAAGPGTLSASDPSADGTATTYRWVMAQPMASYLASVVIGDFELVERPAIGDITMRHVLPPDVVDPIMADIDGLYEEMFPLFEERFGPYPFDDYGVVGVPEPLSFALENQTLSLFGTDTLLDTAIADRFHAHELAHQWFGDSVSLTDWDDIWLNEGFASWADFDWTGRQANTNLFDAIAAGSGELGPLTDFRPHEMFDTRVYVRGGLSLEALRRTVGDDQFFRIIRLWVDTYGGRDASTSDFLSLVGDELGEGPRQLMSDWIYDDQMPELPPL